jgi:hypothetical protein
MMTRLLASAPVLLLAGIALAQNPAASAPSAGLANDWLRSQSDTWKHFDFGGQIRTRLEARDGVAIPGFHPNTVDFRRDHAAGNTYLLLRERLHLGYSPTDWITGFVEGRDSSSHWDRRLPNPETDRFDLHQAFVRLGDPGAFPLVATVGRQEFNYGDQRLVGAFEWNNIGRVFDAAKIRFQHADLWVDAFAGRVVIPANHRFNVSNDYELFSGIYASSSRIVSWQETQLYFFARNTGDESPEAIGSDVPPFQRGASPRDIYTIGARVKSLPGRLGPWDYSAEAAWQFGDFRFAPGAARLDQQAGALHVGAGYSWPEARLSPRLGVEYNFSTGDGDPNDGKHETFDNLFPTNHRFYGYMDFFSWQNVHNPRLSLSARPAKKVSITADLHAFWLADTEDFFYQANGSPRNTGGYGLPPGAGSFVGSEIDLVVTWELARWAGFQAGYGHFFRGDYVQDTFRGSGGSRDADWAYVQAAFTF